MNTKFIATLLVLCIQVSTVSTYSGPHSCSQSYTCYGSRYTHCGVFGWGRCRRTYSKTCYRSVCCSGWSSDGRGGCTKPICDPPCANGGSCIAPSTCECTIYYQGNKCWEKKDCKGKQFDLMLILDSSGSIGRINFEHSKQFAKTIVQSLDVGSNRTRLSLMTYSRYPVIRFQLDEHTTKTSVLDAIDEVPYISGITETYAALTLLQQEGFSRSRSNVPHVAIIITEGTSRHVSETASIASTLHRQGVTIFAIGVGSTVATSQLNVIATDPDNRHTFKVNTYQSLSTILHDLITLTCDVSPHTYPTNQTQTECDGKVADILLILDSSINIGETHFKSVEHFAMDIINDLDIGENTTQVGVLTFNTYPVIRQTLNDDKLHLLNAVNQMPYYSGTRETDRALELLRLEGYDGDRYTAPNVAIIITNGQSHDSFLTKRSAYTVKQNDIEVFVVGVGSGVDRNELKYMASDPTDTHMSEVSNFAEFGLSNFEFEVARNVCDTIKIITSTTTTTTTTTPTPMPTTEESVSVQNYSSCIPEVADVIFLVDSSTSVGVANFKKVKEFIKQAIGIFSVGMNETRIGLITYSTNAQIVISLDQYNNSQDIIDAVDNIKYTSGGTNTGQALELMRTQGFLRDRNVTSNIAFLITDGFSKDQDATRQQARLAKQDQFVMVVTSIGTHLDFRELTAIASENPATNGNLIYQVNTFDELQAESLQDVLELVVCGISATTVSQSSTTMSPEVTNSSLSMATRTTMSGTFQVTSKTTAPPLPATPSLNSSCYDKLDTCIAFGQDVCADYRPWAMEHCRHYCGFCEGPSTPRGPCEDVLDNCEEYGPSICITSTFILWTRDNCPRYCHLCDPEKVTATTPPPVPTTSKEPSCINTVNNCAELGRDMCSNQLYKIWAEAHCREYCGFCSRYVEYQGSSIDNNICPDWRLPKACKMVPVEGHCCPLPLCPSGYVLSADHPNQQ